MIVPTPSVYGQIPPVYPHWLVNTPSCWLVNSYFCSRCSKNAQIPWFLPSKTISGLDIPKNLYGWFRPVLDMGLGYPDLLGNLSKA